MNETTPITPKSLFFCYSKNLAEFILNNKIKYITKAYTYNNNKLFWLFVQSDELNEIIAKYEEFKWS